tara:strand:+ start:2392 stop:3462 length:1071 start_codon:yes stop_codon:yes gene_type:complete
LNTVKLRLRLGQANIGFWLLLSISIILFKKEIEMHFIDISSVSIISVFIFLSIFLQLPFDIYGAKKLYSHGQKNSKWLVQWFRGIIALSACWALLSFLIFLIQPRLGFCMPVLITMILIFQMHEKFIIFINSDKYNHFDVRNFKGQSLLLNCSENTFTGGVVYGFFKSTQIIPESWSSSPYLKIECFRRSLIIKNKFVIRSFVFLTFWNLLGVLLGEMQGLYYSENIGISIIYLSCWMTIWSFLALILMPRLSHSTVYAIDYLANKYDSVRLKKWINNFAELIDENGDKSKLVQSVFYPIPTVENRINSLNTSPSYCFGNISRQNLFLSWGVFNLSCRSVHCNIGRPVLWAFPPSA